MSDELPQFPQGLPVLFFHEDPREVRLRVEGARAAPSAVPMPRIGASGGPDLEYPLIQFPWEPWSAGLETQSLARAYASWLNDIGPGRLALIVPLLEQAGAPARGLRDDPAMLAELGGWVQQMFPVLAAPLIEQGFLRDLPSYRLGWVWRGWSPRSQIYSRHLDALLGSLAHDLALIVADCARAVRPALAWQPYYDTRYRSFVVGLDPEPPCWDLFHELTDFLAQSAAWPRGTRGHDLRNWYGRTLLRSYERAAHGAVGADVAEEFPDLHTQRGYPRRGISRPVRSTPAAPAELVAAVAMMQDAGWFDAVKFSTQDLARAAQAAWRSYEREDIPLAAAEMYWRLLILDSDRTWSDDVDAGVRPGDGIYTHLLDEVSRIRGEALGWLRDASEDWESRPGDLLLSFRSKGGRHQLLIPSPGQYLSPAMVTGLNDLAGADGPRLWFVDAGPPIAIVTRATAAERAALESGTGLRLDPDPPSWWTRLAPLPDRQPAAPPKRRPATRGRGARSARPDARPAEATRSGAGSRSRRSQGRPADTGAITAQVAFDRMMRSLIAPGLHELGFTGTGSRWLTCRHGDYEALFSTQKSRYSTRHEVQFWVHLTGVHVPTNSVYWTAQLAGLMPGETHPSRWTVRADSPVDAVAEHLLSAFRGYGWPAIQAALDSPGYPPDPAVTWPRAFPPQPTPAALGDTGPNLGGLTWALRRTGQRDDLFRDLGDADERVRSGAVADIGRAADSDPAVVAALLSRLEHDPSPLVRSTAAAALRPLARQPRVGSAFQAAASQDEDYEVRWAARYALRLADLAGQSSA